MTLPPLEEQRSCELCGTPIPGAADPEERFCCAGCRQVHEVLANLDESTRGPYLAAARRLGVIPAGPDAGADAPSDEPLPDDPDAIRAERFALGGLACPSCAWVAEQVLETQPAVKEAAVDFFSGTALIGYDLRQTSAADLESLLAPLGYRLEPIRDQARSGLSRRATMEFVIAAVITMNIMALASVRYFEGLGYLDQAPRFLVWLELALTLPVLYIGWLPLVRRALTALRRKRVTGDLLIGIAVGAAALLSVGALITGRDDIYLETCAGLVTIALLSQMIEARLRARAHERLAPLLRMRVERVRVIDGDRERYAGIDEVGAGDRVAFLPGETVAFDGEVIGAPVSVSEAVLTGEPEPLTRSAGDAVVAGSSVVAGRLELVIARRFDQTRLHRITQSLLRSLGRAESRLRSADRITLWFVPAVLVVAVGAWLVRLLLFGLDHALSADGWFPSVAVLAVACPCAFSLAGISAITAATGRLLQQGFLVKEPDQLERIGRVDRVVFDKTGTLTRGEMQVERLVWRDEPRAELLPLVLAVERGSMHPVAQAIRAHLGAGGLVAAAAVLEIRDLGGQGRAADVDGRELTVGAAALFEERFDLADPAPGCSAVWFGYDRRAAGCFLLSDSLRPEAAGAVAALQRAGLAVELVSGDRRSVTESVAATAGIGRVAGGMTIEDKVARMRELRQGGAAVAFVGDGTNDALAMAEGAAAVAISGATDEALSASGFVELRGSLSGLPGLFDLGRRLTRVIRGNYVWALGFNTLFIPVAALGRLVPLAAMALMLVSSAAVLLNSLRLRR